MTATQIELIKKHGLSVRGHLGQHLLIDPNIQKKIVDLLELTGEETVLEIGPGLGALTGELLRRGSRVFAVEKDKSFCEVLRREFEPAFSDKLDLFQADILKFDFQKRICEEKKIKGKIKVVSNLPYYITAPVLFYLADHRDQISLAVLTMQKEVAARLTASPGTKDYGRLTLAVRYTGDVEPGFLIPPTCFTPRPEVMSSVVRIRFFEKKQRRNEALFFYLIARAFSQRRKTLMNLLSKDKRFSIGRESLARFFQEQGWPEKVRGEELLLKDYFILAEELSKNEIN